MSLHFARIKSLHVNRRFNSLINQKNHLRQKEWGETKHQRISCQIFPPFFQAYKGFQKHIAHDQTIIKPVMELTQFKEHGAFYCMMFRYDLFSCNYYTEWNRACSDLYSVENKKNYIQLHIVDRLGSCSLKHLTRNVLNHVIRHVEALSIILKNKTPLMSKFLINNFCITKSYFVTFSQQQSGPSSFPGASCLS